LDVKVFWVLIGSNDLGLDDCSADVVAAGNIRIVEELQSRQPNAKIVLNSILPFASRSGERDEELFESRAWQVASRFNQWLECYAGTMENVEFFNATSIFVKEDETVIVAEYFEDPVHPSAAGALVWAQAIINQLLGLIDG
jgi:lysophospholipase L1-like esterase